MSSLKKINLYETFHRDRKLQKRIIGKNNFTYRELIKTLTPYLTQCHSILDIGSGVETIDFYLASLGKSVTGIEISQQAVDLAKANAKIFNLDKKITFIAAAFPDKLPKKQFDMVIFSEVIEHLDDDKKALRDIWKVLKPGGLLVITTPSQNAPLYRMGLLYDFDKEVGHVRRYTERNLHTLVEKEGFRILSSGKQEGILRNFLFTNPLAGKFLRIVRGPLSDIVAGMDYATIPFGGTSNLSLVAKKR